MKQQSFPVPLSSVARCSCGGVCESRIITFTLRRSPTDFVMLQNVPAEVCQNCGEPQFAMRVTEYMMAATHSDRSPDGYYIMPMYDLAAR